MSVTFTAIKDAKPLLQKDASEYEAPCLCAQMAPSWGMDIELSDREELRKFASPQCPLCQGSGVEICPPQTLSYNLANDNAARLLSLLGLGRDDLIGNLDLPSARRAVIRAKAQFNRRAPALVRPEERLYGAPHTQSDGTVELHPLRVVSQGLSADQLYARLITFEQLIVEASQQGATHIHWD